MPNDIRSGGQHGKMKILTGPNASGKSVYLKQVRIDGYENVPALIKVLYLDILCLYVVI